MLKRCFIAALMVASLSGCASDSSPVDSPMPPSMTVASPDPTVAGSLTEESLPQSWLGFEGSVVAPEEGEFNPNDSWVHGQDPTLIAGEAMPQCSTTESVQVPVPTAALTGTYRDSADQPANGVALEFATQAQAQEWFSSYATEIAACSQATEGLFTVVEHQLADGVLVDVRDYSGQLWSERVSVTNDRVVLLIAIGRFSVEQLLAPIS